MNIYGNNSDYARRLYRLIYNRWIIGWSNLNIVDRMVLDPYDPYPQLEELRRNKEKYFIMPIGRHVSLFPPPYSSEDEETIVIEVSHFNHVNILYNIADLGSGVSYYEAVTSCFKEGLYLPLTPPISSFESLGGLFSTGFFNFWYGNPRGIFVLRENLYFFNRENVFNSFGRNGVAISFLIKCISLEDGFPIYIRFRVKDVGNAVDLSKQFLYRHGIYPRLLVGYMDRDSMEVLASFSPRMYKIFRKRVLRKIGVYEESLYEPVKLYPRVKEFSNRDKKIYLIDFFGERLIEIMKRRECRIIYIDFIKDIGVVECEEDIDFYVRRVEVEDGLVKKVDYKDVSCR